MNVKKASLVLKEPAVEQSADNGATRPKNPPSNVRPTEGYNAADNEYAALLWKML